MELTSIENGSNPWAGAQKPMNASYGKLMMWFFIVSDALTFSGFWFPTDFPVLKTLILGLLLTKFLPTFPFFTALMPLCIM